MKLKKVISGGQTGADRTGLECAKELGLQTGGTAPLGYRTETGKDLSLKDFGLTESADISYVPRTRANAKNSDVTLWFGNTNSPGYYCTKKACKDWGKELVENPDAQMMVLVSEKYTTVNVAGNRKSTNPNVVERVQNAFRALSKNFCLCTPSTVCAFHKRGGYTTVADEVPCVQVLELSEIASPEGETGRCSSGDPDPTV